MSLAAAQDEFIDLFVIDVTDFPHAYKETICAQPSLWAMRLIAGLSEPEVRKMLSSLKAERSKCAVPRKVTS